MTSLGQAAVLIIIIIMAQSCHSNEFKVRSSIYTRSCPEGEFVVKKLSSGMKFRRYRFLIERSNSFQGLLKSKMKAKWYKLHTEDSEVNFPRISQQNSYIMVYKSLQKYSASVQFLIKNTTGKLKKDLKGIKNELRKVMCSVEGLLNGMHAEQIKYKFVSEKNMEIWLRNTLNNGLSPLTISKELVNNLLEFNEIILEVANQRLKIISEHKRKITPKNLKA